MPAKFGPPSHFFRVNHSPIWGHFGLSRAFRRHPYLLKRALKHVNFRNHARQLYFHYPFKIRTTKKCIYRSKGNPGKAHGCRRCNDSRCSRGKKNTPQGGPSFFDQKLGFESWQHRFLGIRKYWEGHPISTGCSRGIGKLLIEIIAKLSSCLFGKLDSDTNNSCRHCNACEREEKPHKKSNPNKHSTPND